jgi:hypothetical protein
MGFELEMGRGARSIPRTRPATLDGLVAALESLERFAKDLAEDAARVRDHASEQQRGRRALETWAAAKPGRRVTYCGGAVSLVRRGRGIVQVAAYRGPALAAAAVASESVAWIDVSSTPGSKRWRGPAKKKDRVRAG